jgi:2-polyprenyl-6-methoxyphenol hydroxylase-like FAD-dependent oxidoreductase
VSADHDIAIVGYGPVGQTLAILLADGGWRVAIYEKQPEAYPLPRAVHFDHEVGRILQATGVSAAIEPASEAADAYEWRNGAGHTLLRFESRALAESGWPEANMFSQPDLDRRARSFANVSLHRACEATRVAASETSVAIEFRTPDGEERRSTARFAIGCDGANSLVRRQIDATVTDLGFFFDWLIVDVVPHEPKPWRPTNIQICDPARPTTLVSGGPGRRRWEFMRLPGEEIEELNTETTAWRLLAPWNVNRDNARLERHTVYRFQARWVDGWRRGRVLLAGDAAHQMPPFAGQGLCSGLRDAANLAWKLDLVLAGKAPIDLLDTYASERIPHVRALIDLSMELGNVICVPDPTAAAARDAAMISAHESGQATVPLPAPRLGPGLQLEGDARAGALFVQGRVEHAGRVGRFDDTVGRGWTLLCRAADPLAQLDSAAAAFFSSIGGIGPRVGRNGPVRDVDGTYGKWFDRARAEIVLQRPDFYVFGTGASPKDAGLLVGALRNALGGSERRV